MRKGRDGEKKKRGKKKDGKKRNTYENSGHYVIASSRPPERRPLERRTLAPKKREKKKKRRMKIVATTSLQAVDRLNADRWNAACSCQNKNKYGYVHRKVKKHVCKKSNGWVVQVPNSNLHQLRKSAGVETVFGNNGKSALGRISLRNNGKVQAFFESDLSE